MCLIAVNIFSQESKFLAGIVLDVKGQPLIGANIQLEDFKQNRMIGTSTDIEGKFSIQIKQGNYIIRISHVGYTTYIADIHISEDIQLPIIKLEINSLQMDAVLVTAKTMTYNARGYIAEISKNPLYREQNMNTILRLSPGTNTTTNNIQAYGQDVSIVYLNGREIKLSGEQLINYLGTLEGKYVKQMEVITSSGVEEDANTMGKPIIKITTINPETGGMASMGNTFVPYADGVKYSHTPNVNLNYRLNKKWSLYFNGGIAFNKTTKKSRTETCFYNTGKSLSSEQDNRLWLKGFYRTLWGINYDLDTNNFFSLEASYNNRNSDITTQDIIHHINQKTGEQYTEGIIENKTKYWQSNLSFTYKHKFSNNGELSFQTDRIEKDTKIKEFNSYMYTDGRKSNINLNDEKHLLYTIRLDYTQHIKKESGLLNIGMKYSNISDRQNMYYTLFANSQKDNDRSYIDLYKYSEKVYAAYAKYSFKAGKLDFNAGLRLEHALLSPRSSSDSKQEYESIHTDWAPEFGVSYTLDKNKGHRISLQYTHSISRPLFVYLNPLTKRVNEYTYSMGNPLLNSGKSNRYSLRTILFDNYTIIFNHKYIPNGIVIYPEYRDGVIYMKPQRGRKHTEYSVYIDIPFKLRQWGKMDFSVEYIKREESYKNYKNNNNYWNFHLSNIFNLPYEYNINTNISHSTPIKSLYEKTHSNMYVSVQINKLFFNRSLNISLSFNDLLNSDGTRINEYYYDNFSQISQSLLHGFNISASIRYTLRWGQKSMVRRGGSGNIEESSRLGTD